MTSKKRRTVGTAFQKPSQPLHKRFPLIRQRCRSYAISHGPVARNAEITLRLVAKQNHPQS
jgi:hypothetical protein